MTPLCTVQGNQAQGMEIILVLILGLYTDMRTSILGTYISWSFEITGSLINKLILGRILAVDLA